MDHFELHSEYKPTGDQPQAIERLVRAEDETFKIGVIGPMTGDYDHGRCQ